MTEINLDYMKPTTLAAIIIDLHDAIPTNESAANPPDIRPILREIFEHAIDADGLETLIGNIRRVDLRR